MYRISQSYRCGPRSDPSQPLRARRSRLTRASIHLGVALGLFLPSMLLAQDGGGRRHAPDFLLGKPAVTIAIRGGMLFPRAASQAFTVPISEMFLKRSDFYAPAISAEVGYWNPRFDVTGSLGYARSAKKAEYRHYLDNNDAPIENWTRLAQVPMTVAVRAYLVPRGREIGRYAWVPTRNAPYIGVAAGGVYHRYRQNGDFILFDNPNLPVVSNTYLSSGVSPMVQVLVGNELTLTRRTSLQLEARYGWSSADMGSDFQGFDKIDLSGLQTTLGFAWRL